MESILVWYFLTSSVVAIGPFTSRDECVKFNKWAYQYKYTSECWQAPVAARQPYSIETHPKTSPDVR